MPAAATIGQALDDAVERFADRPWMMFGGETRSFGRLGTDVSAITTGLVALGLQVGDRLGLYMGNRFEWLEVEYATTGIGGWLVPVNTMLRSRELTHVIGQSAMSTLVWTGRILGQDTRDLLLDLVPELDGDAAGRWRSRTFPALRTVVGVGDGPWPPGVTPWDELLRAGRQVHQRALGERRAAVGGDDVALVMYTSGTTGAPKGAMIRHRGVAQHVGVWCGHLGLAADDRSIMASPLFWSFGCTINAIVPLLAGSAIVLEERFRPAEFLRDLVAHRCTHLQGVPTQYEMALGHPDAEDSDLSGIRLVQIGGSSSAEGLARRLLAKTPRAQFVSSYGLTEAVGVNTFTDLGDPLEDVARGVGHASPDNDVQLRDDDGHPVAPGEVGELWMRGPHVMAGYFDNPEATAVALVDDWLRTGDLATSDERGYLRIVGRRSDAFKRGGMNVYPAEIEGVLQDHPGVAQAAVVGAHHQELGEVGVAFLVLADGGTLDVDELATFCAERLAGYKVPAEFRLQDALPTTPTGKVQKFKLVELLAAERAEAIDQGPS